MDWLIIVCNIIVTSVVGLFFHCHLPKYFEEKATNLATKEDIGNITEITESVKLEFNEQMQIFSTQHTFHHHFSYERYAKLYSQLYGYVLQSEYARYFHEIDSASLPFQDVPYLEIVTKNQKQRFENGYLEVEEKIIENELYNHNKQKLYQTIIEQSEYASQELLKLAFSYRIVHFFYGDKNKNQPVNEKANDEELRLIRELVICIVKEYNQLRKKLDMSYDKHELQTGRVYLRTQK